VKSGDGHHRSIGASQCIGASAQFPAAKSTSATLEPRVHAAVITARRESARTPGRQALHAAVSPRRDVVGLVCAAADRGAGGGDATLKLVRYTLYHADPLGTSHGCARPSSSGCQGAPMDHARAWIYLHSCAPHACHAPAPHTHLLRARVPPSPPAIPIFFVYARADSLPSLSITPPIVSVPRPPRTHTHADPHPMVARAHMQAASGRAAGGLAVTLPASGGGGGIDAVAPEQVCVCACGVCVRAALGPVVLPYACRPLLQHGAACGAPHRQRAQTGACCLVCVYAAPDAAPPLACPCRLQH
jgi:hypothetical protein